MLQLGNNSHQSCLRRPTFECRWPPRACGSFDLQMSDTIIERRRPYNSCSSPRSRTALLVRRQGQIHRVQCWYACCTCPATSIRRIGWGSASYRVAPIHEFKGFALTTISMVISWAVGLSCFGGNGKPARLSYVPVSRRLVPAAPRFRLRRPPYLPN